MYKFMKTSNSKAVFHHNANAAARRTGSQIEYNNSVFKNRPFSSENKYGIFRRNNPNLILGAASSNIKHPYNNLDNIQAAPSTSAYHDQNDDNGRAISALLGYSKAKSKTKIMMDVNLHPDNNNSQDIKSAGQRLSSQKRKDFILPPINQRQDQGQFNELIPENIENYHKMNLEIEVSQSLSDGD